jgi:hypothetical protein
MLLPSQGIKHLQAREAGQKRNALVLRLARYDASDWATTTITVSTALPNPAFVSCRLPFTAENPESIKSNGDKL